MLKIYIMKNKLTKSVLALMIWVVYTMPMYAFPGPPDGTDDPLPPEAPIDNWILALVGAGLIVAAIAIHKMYRKSVA